MKKLFTAGILFMIISCSPHVKEVGSSANDVTLGEIDLQVTGDPVATEHFKKGLLLLHSFEYADARKSFIDAQQIDSDFAMAYWGEVMTYNHPLWSQQYYEEGLASLQKLGNNKEERIALAPTELEKDMLMAIEILFGTGEKTERDDLYAAHMAILYEKYPGNHEVAAFYALSLLGSVEEGRNYEIYGKGAIIAQGILEENPSHPGALHYLIHAYDDPDHASLAKDAADAYSKVAPDAGHALHMPSHIYIAMGMWDEVIRSNIDSYQARMNKIAASGSGSRNLHAYHWLMYGYLQKGNYEQAQEMMKDMADYITQNKSSGARYYLIEMLGNYLAEAGDWTGPYAEIRVKSEDLNIQSRASQLFIDGYLAFIKGQSENMEATISVLRSEIESAASLLLSEGVTICSGVSFAARNPSSNDVNTARVLLLELESQYALLQGDMDSAEDLMLKAVDLESKISFSFGPPSIVIPTYELYGRWLLKQERYEEALEQFERSLDKGPGRRSALLGKLESARGLGDDEMARELELKLEMPEMYSS